MPFVHLHVHTEYSSLDGMIRTSELFDVVAGHGQNAAAVTDHGTLGGIWAAQDAATKAGVKLIPGQEMYLAKDSRFSKIAFEVPKEDTSADEDTQRSSEIDGKNAEMIVDAERDRKMRPYQHLTVLAATPEGWRNLVIMNNEAQNSIWQKPRIDYALLKKHSEGIIVLTGCLGGPIIGPLSYARRFDAEADNLQALVDELASSDGDPTVVENATMQLSRLRADAERYRQDAESNILAMIDAVGAENVYVEVMDHGIESESAALADVVELARRHGLQLVATNDAHHTHEHGQQSQAAWLLVQSKSTLANPKFQFHGHGYWLKTEDEMRAVRPEPWWQEACDNTQLVADRIADKVIPGHRDLLPRFTAPEGFASNREYIYHLLRDGARRIYGGITPTVKARVSTEMEVIEESGYIDYFLVVHDVIAWCVRNNILVGPGRGSAGGSLVAYLLGITRVDPLRYNLLFERFLERGRQEPPDIDIDFPQSRRDDVIAYLADRWGADKVAFIGTFQLARSRAAIKDAARVLGYTPVGEKMAKLVPMAGGKPMALTKLTLESEASAAEYRRLLDKVDDSKHLDEQGRTPARQVHDLAVTFEDVVKGVGIHASGIIVSAVPLHDLVPMRRTKRGWVLQWTGPEAEKVGLLKVDVLGLRNLDIVAKTVEYIHETTGVLIDPLALPDPDMPPAEFSTQVAAAWRTIAEGRTEGLFQLESPAMTSLAQDVAPHSLNDLSALVALFRPGPMGKGLHTEYAARKRDNSLISYRDYTVDPAEAAALATVLGETHGLFVYQEQVMQLGTVVAGFDAAGRSTLRKAVSKKKKDVMEVVGGKFRDGAPREHRDGAGNVISIPFSDVTVNALWDAMVSFAEYAFNRSHSATYGYLAYITAYLKGNWPVEFAAATLAVTSGKEKRLQVLRSLRREGIEVLAPDINESTAWTAPAGGRRIRIGLSEVKSLGETGGMIVDRREKNGRPFTSIQDLYLTVTKTSGNESGNIGSAIDSGHVTSLIEAGALDAWCGGNRLGLMSVAAAAKTGDVAPFPMEWSILERATRQRNALGLLIGQHPLVALQDQVRAYTPYQSGNEFDYRSSAQIYQVEEIPNVDGQTVTVIGVVDGWTEAAYARGRRANILLEGINESISGTMWDRDLTDLKESGLPLPVPGDIVAVTGRVRFRTIMADPDDESAVDQTVKELGVTRVRVVPVNDPTRGSWPTSDVSVPNFVRGPFEHEEAVAAAEPDQLDLYAPAQDDTYWPEAAPAAPADNAPAGGWLNVAPTVIPADADPFVDMGASMVFAEVTTTPERSHATAVLTPPVAAEPTWIPTPEVQTAEPMPVAEPQHADAPLAPVSAAPHLAPVTSLTDRIRAVGSTIEGWELDMIPHGAPASGGDSRQAKESGFRIAPAIAEELGLPPGMVRKMTTAAHARMTSSGHSRMTFRAQHAASGLVAYFTLGSLDLHVAGDQIVTA